MNFYFDVEFEDFTENPGIISFGIVSENGNELYVEFIDTWKLEQCSCFIEDRVLPLLGNHGPESLTSQQFGIRLLNWLSDQLDENTQAVYFVADSDWDWFLLLTLLSKQAAFLRTGSISVELGGSRRIILFQKPDCSEPAFSEREALILGYAQGEEHHALIDARALRFALTGRALKQVQAPV